MSAKPTPGPFEIVLHVGDLTKGFEAKNPAGIVAIFPIEDGWGLFAAKSKDEAEANARAFVDGMAALETIQKIRAFEREFSESRMNAYQAMTAIAGILDEAKP